MNHYNHLKQNDRNNAEVIDFCKRSRKILKNSAPSGSFEAFMVTADKIFFLAVLYLDSNQCCQGSGYTIFADGDTLHFTMDGNEQPDVREKCLKVGRRLANVYNGTLKTGKIDAQGRAHLWLSVASSISPSTSR